MFHAFDKIEPNRPLRRPDWMALLAHAPLSLLEEGLGLHTKQKPLWLRRPETGLYMVQGRAGGTAERFNLGEITVTRCALRLSGGGDSPVGVAYVMGRNHRQAQLAAMADALLQDPAQQDTVDSTLLLPVRQHLAQVRALRAARAEATKVDFFTVAREASDASEESDA